MVKKSMYKEILNFKKKGYLKAEISRELDIDPGTVAKYFNMSDTQYRDYVKFVMYREKAFKKHKNEILEVYEKNEYKKLPVSSVYDYLEEIYGNLPGNEKTLRNYVSFLLESSQLVYSEKVRHYTKVPELPMGKQMQLDFGEYTTRSGFKIYIFASVLSASRFKYAAFQDRPFTTQDLIMHLMDCFFYLDGTPEEIVIDQDRVMVVSENHGDIIYTKDFSYFIQEMDLSMYVCRKADPESKGKVENLVKYVKTNFLASRDFASIEEAQERLALWIKRANSRISRATKMIPGELIEEERKSLKPLRNSIYNKTMLSEREERLVDRSHNPPLISVQASQYSIPESCRKQRVEIYQTDDLVFIFDIESGEQIAEHKLASIPGSKVIAREHVRKTGSTAGEMRRKVLERFPFPGWKSFAEANFKQFPRYVRDQCIEAERYFSRDINTDALKKALDFCLENKTWSMANLRDTYQYYIGIEENCDKDILGRMKPRLKEAVEYKNKICVEKRDLGVYKAFMNTLMGVLL